MKATDLAVAAYFWNLNHCAHHLWTHPELPGDRGEASGPFSNWRRCSSSPCPSSGPPAMAAAPAHSCFGLCPPASPPPGKGGVEEGAAPLRFPLTTAWPAGPLGLGQASSGAWSRGPRSKPGPWQPLRVKSRGWKVLKVMAGASRLPVSTEKFLSQGLHLSLPPTTPRLRLRPSTSPPPRQSRHRTPEGQAQSSQQEKGRRGGRDCFSGRRSKEPRRRRGLR